MWRRASNRFPNRHSSLVSFLLCCRVLKPPGGGSSNLFGSAEEVSSSSKPHRMASNIFGASEEPQNLPKRTNPPGKGSHSHSMAGLWSAEQSWVCAAAVQCCCLMSCFYSVSGPEHWTYSHTWRYEYFSDLHIHRLFSTSRLILSKLRPRKWWKEAVSILELCC